MGEHTDKRQRNSDRDSAMYAVYICVERTRETEKQKEEGERNTHTHTQMLRQRDLHVQPAATDDKLLHLSHDNTPMERGGGGRWSTAGEIWSKREGKTNQPTDPYCPVLPTYIRTHIHTPPGSINLHYTTLHYAERRTSLIKQPQTMTDNDNSQRQQPKDYSDYPTYRKCTCTVH